MEKRGLSKGQFIKQKRLVLFLSVDLIGSTSHKSSRKDNFNWRFSIVDFLTNFPLKFRDTLEKEKKVGESILTKKEDFAKIKKKPPVWKKLGDEILFYFELNSFKEVTYYIYCFRETLNFYNVKGKQKIRAKGTAWTGGFPVGNLIILDPQDKEYYPKDLDHPDLSGKTDFVGPDIDIGFRLSKYSSLNKLVISVELAYILTKTNETMDKPLLFYIDGERVLQGVLNDKEYPIFWISMDENYKYTTALMSNLDKEKLCQYAKYFITKIKKNSVPFINGEDEGANYKEKYEKYCKAYGIQDVDEAKSSIGDGYS